MKALNKLFIAAMAAATMTACSNELTEQQTSSNGIINFKMGIGTPAPSRTAMADDGYSATFEAGDQVGIFVKDMDSYTNLLYSTEDGNNWTGNPIKAPDEGGFSYTFYAYYPYSASVTDASNITTTVATDQNTDGFIKNDFLVSTATTSNETVNLPFDHALSLVEVMLKGSNAADDATVNILDVATDATIDLTAETAPTVTTGNTKANVAMDALEGTPKYRAIILAQDITANTALFEINSNGRKYTASYENNIKFEQGKYLAMIITLGEAEEGEEGDATIEIVPGATINDWEEGTGGEGGEVVETPLISEFPESIPVLGTDAIKDQANSTWFNIIKSSDYATASVTNAETAGSVTPEWSRQANLTFKSVNGDSNGTNNWYSAVIGYFNVGAIDLTSSNIYELSFKAKGTNKFTTETNGTADQSSKNAPNILVTCRNAANNASFSIRNNTETPTATNSTLNLNTDGSWKECKFYIHFYQKKEGSPSSYNNDNERVTTTQDDYAKIQIRINTNNKASEKEPYLETSISITDVKLIPYIAE